MYAGDARTLMTGDSIGSFGTLGDSFSVMVRSILT